MMNCECSIINAAHFYFLERKVSSFVVMESPAIHSYECSHVFLSQRYCIHTITIGASSLRSQPVVNELK